ncbi:glycosyltransferase [Sphingomicrobium arenosum]|uniref:glycosyltransferase n=1 Tax=Sphingomicrobium arenosum TaxID=2233861 RepID=UPI0022406814|nr:glycosyltransferase [Sphingomicrobium arenosum]
MVAFSPRPRRIAVIAHARFPIAAPFKGGMEAHTHALVRGLLARGHEVRLFASGDSDPLLPLEPVCERHYEADMPWARWRHHPQFAERQSRIFAEAWEGAHRFMPDIVHNNSLFAELPRWAARDGAAMLSVLHVPPFPRLHDAVTAMRDEPRQRFATVSAAQLAHWAPGGHRHFAAVPNGIDLARWPVGGGQRRGAIWVGRITPSKGTAMACEAAVRAGIGLTLYGPVEDEIYFDQQVAPWLGQGVRHAGEQPAQRLAEAYGAAEVALVTPCWDEPFGLVAAEALSCGTPVAGFDRGAIAEVVGEAGCLVAEGDVEGLAQAIHEARQVRRSTCVERARRFSHDAMLAGYEALYEAAISGAVAASASASSCASTIAELA